AIILAGAFVGAFLRTRLPDQDLGDAKEIFRLGAGLVATIAALVLSLLISSAKSSYDTQSTQVQRLAADMVQLDHLLAQYGPEASPVRDLLRRAVGPMVDRIWWESGSRSAKRAPFAATAESEGASDKLEELVPQTEFQRSLKA